MKKFIVSLLILISITLALSLGRYYRYKRKSERKEFHESNEKLPGDWLDMQRIYPYGKINTKEYLTQMEKAERMHGQSTEKYQWEQAGPTNIGGRIVDIEIDPTDDNTIYIAGASGGIFKTTDAGNNWQHIFTEEPAISMGDIAIDPNDHNVIYAGTGEANSSSFSFFGNGIYKSVDGGESWQSIGLENTGYIGRIVVDYSNSDRIFVAALGCLFQPSEERGVYRSLDGGETWQRTLFVSDSTSAVDLVQDPQNPDILYAAMWERMRGLNYRRSGGPTSGIYKSIDGGDTWFELTNGLPNNGTEGRIGLAISQTNPNVLYASYDNAPFGESESFLGVYKTEDGGDSWTGLNTNALSQMYSSFGWYFGQIRVDPTNENRVYCMGVEMWRTDNGGSSWTVLSDYGTMDEIHVDHHAMVFSSTGRIYEGNDGGFYYSDDLGNNWHKINNLPISQFYQIAIDNNHPERLYGGLQDNGSVRTYNGDIDGWQQTLGGDGFYNLVSPLNSDIFFAEYQYGQLYRFSPSENWGNYISPVNNDRTNWSSPYDLFATSSDISGITIYFGTYRVYKSTNGGNSWQIVSDDMTRGESNPDSGYNTISTLAISPLNHNYILCGSDDGLVHISLDGGNSWQNITGDLPNRWITKVAFDPIDENTIYATVSGFRWNEPLSHVFVSHNLGVSWESISSNLPEIPVNCIAIDPQNNQHLFVGTDSGVFMSANGGEEWVSASYGMPHVPIYDIKIHNQSRTMVVATHGCSSFKINLDTGFVDSQNNQVANIPLKIGKVYPNPFNIQNSAKASVGLEFFISSKKFVSISVYNIKGQKVKDVADRFFEAGKNIVFWDGLNNRGKKVDSGVYLFKIKTDNFVPLVKKVTLVK